MFIEKGARIECLYNRVGNFSEQKTYGPDGQLGDRAIFELDGNGRVVTGRTRDGGEGVR